MRLETGMLRFQGSPKGDAIAVREKEGSTVQKENGVSGCCMEDFVERREERGKL